MSKKMSYVYVPSPNLEKLVNQLGSAEAGRQLGLADPGKMIREGKVRKAYEMAATSIVNGLPEMPKEDGPKTFVVKIPQQHVSTLKSLFGTLNCDVLELNDL